MRHFIYLITITALAAFALSSCNGEAPTAPPQVVESTEALEATEAVMADDEEKKPEESAPTNDVALPKTNPADVPGDVNRAYQFILGIENRRHRDEEVASQLFFMKLNRTIFLMFHEFRMGTE